MTDRHFQLGEKMVQSGVISRDEFQRALAAFQQGGGRIEEILIEQGALDEEKLLKFLASIYQTKYVSTDKLKVAQLGAELIEKVPQKLAEKYEAVPILYEEAGDTLSLIMANPSDLMAVREIQVVSGVKNIKAYVARPASIRAAIARHYKGDIHAFGMLDQEDFQLFHNMMDTYERNMLDEESMATSLADDRTKRRDRDRMISSDEMTRKASAKPSAPPMKKSDGRSTVNEGMIEIINILVSLLENARPDLAGHSALTSRYVRRIAKRLGLGDVETANYTTGALLHDLGKGSPYHLTPLNVSEWEGHRNTALKRCEIPTRLFESVKFPEETLNTIRQMYERFDGKGIPNGVKGKDIPLGARILAIADTYSDLTVNPRNPYRRTLSNKEAIEVLRRHKDKVFDGNILDIFAMMMAGENIKERLSAEAQVILIVDNDPELTTVMELQLVSHGLRVSVARNSDQALQMLEDEKHPIRLVLSEVDLEPMDGFELFQKMHEEERLAEIPVIFFTSRAASEDVQRGYDIGAADYVMKPSTTDVLVAKIRKTLDQKPAQATAAGVSGSLKEMSLPDLVQILFHGRKSGQLKLNFGSHKGELHFMTGHVANALFDNLKGEDAFFAMLKFKDGTFVLNPAFEVTEKVINENPEMLLLEGMRRLDEANR